MKKQNLDILKRKVMPFVFIGCIALTGAGCSKKNTDETEEIGYNVIDDTTSRTMGIYNYVLNTDTLDAEGDQKLFAKIVDGSVSSTTRASFSNYYVKNCEIIIPNEYACYGDDVFTNKYFAITKGSIDYQTLQGETFTVVQTEYVANEHLTPDYDSIDSSDVEYLEIQKGDVLGSKVVYLNGEAIAYYQYGIGSTSENVIEFSSSNIEDFVSGVELDSVYRISFTELEEIESQLNSEKVQVLR